MVDSTFCLSLNNPLTAGTTSKERISNEAVDDTTERSTTIPKGSTQKPVEMGVNGTKICWKCGKSKPLTEFYFRKDSNTYRNECKECLKEHNRYRHTGWTSEQYQAMFKKQDGKCAICRQPLASKRYGVLACDHNHLTGQHRGLLCTNCNTALGLLKEDISIFKRAIAYLHKYSGT